jgi:hypothetical protein
LEATACTETEAQAEKKITAKEELTTRRAAEFMGAMMPDVPVRVTLRASDVYSSSSSPS